jgi:hypothetical protein
VVAVAELVRRVAAHAGIGEAAAHAGVEALPNIGDAGRESFSGVGEAVDGALEPYWSWPRSEACGVFSERGQPCPSVKLDFGFFSGQG